MKMMSAVSDEDLKSVDALNSAVKSGVLMSFFGFPYLAATP